MRPTHLARWLLATLVILFAVPPLAADEAILAPPGESVRVPLLLRKLHETHRVLYVTAHPDDEDAGLIAKLVHGEGVDVTLLTLTRGNGGQNEIGREHNGAIAALRTAELESAHRWDGATQWFGSADDFGYSFSVEETFERWGEERMLRELVEAIRLCQPDVIFTLPPGGAGGGQHHQASAQLTHRAMEIAHEQIWPELGAPHWTRRLFSVVWGAGEVEQICSVPLDQFDLLLGASYAEVGARSRSMHKCQGMVTVDPPLPRRTARLALRYDSKDALRSLSHPLEGIEPRVSWSVDGGASFVRERLEKALENPRESITAPITVRRFLQMAPELRRDRMNQPNFAPLASLEQTYRELFQRLVAVRRQALASHPFIGGDQGATITVATENGGDLSLELHQELSAEGWRSAPWSLVLAPGERDLHTVTLPSGLPATLLDGPVVREFPAALPPIRLESTVTLNLVDGIQESVTLPPVPVEARWRDEKFPTLRATTLRVVPDPSIRPARSVEVAPHPSGTVMKTRGEFLLSTLIRGEIEVRLRAEDSRWVVKPAIVTVASPGDGIEIVVPFAATPPEGLESGTTTVFAEARRVDDTRRPPHWSDRGYRRIEYPHIRTTALEETAAVQVVSFECAVSHRAVGYVAGVGDEIPRAIRALGIEFVELEADDLSRGDLSRIQTIVIGVRAYKARDDLRAAHPRLMEWVRAGGTLVVQYQKFEFNDSDGTSPYVPYPGAAVGPGRITDETAPVRVNDPSHPLLTIPNPIGPANWRGWIQERGLYFLDVQPGSPYQDLLTMEDPFPFNAGPRGGALVEAEVGEGRWIYVGLGLWRQAPAGVEGAYRLLANLLAR